MNIGARTLKTSIAVALSVYLCVLLDIQPSLFAAASAVVCMQQSIGKSIRNGLEQLVVNVVSALVAVLLGLVIPIQYLSMAFATIIMIIICTKVFKAHAQVVLAVMSAIFILASPQEQFVEHAVTRFLAILIGLVTANAINWAIVPPNYKKALAAKLIELNNFTVQIFSNSVNRYLYLTAANEEENKKNQNEYVRLLDEAEKLFELFHYEPNIHFSNKQKGKDAIGQQLFKEYLNYNQGLWQRAQDLFFLAEERRTRRREADDPAISSEFKRIFEMLLNVMFNATSYNLELQKKIKGEATVTYPQPHVWSKLNEILNLWQENTPSTNFYIHAWLEVSVVTFHIRWFAKESARLLSLE